MSNLETAPAEVACAATTVAYRLLWQDADERFGAVEGYRGPVSRLSAPPLPATRLRPRPPHNRTAIERESE
jgi:hypothetical protein